MPATTTRTVKWSKSFGGRFAYLRSCKLVELASGGYLVERVGTDLMPTGNLGVFEKLSNALAAIEGEPAAVCQGCGRSVVPGYQVPDPGYPCPTG